MLRAHALQIAAPTTQLASMSVISLPIRSHNAPKCNWLYFAVFTAHVGSAVGLHFSADAAKMCERVEAMDYQTPNHAAKSERQHCRFR
jgi:hypothetical protein